MLTRGFLTLQTNGRFGVVIKELTCGTPVRVFIDGELIKGTIEYRLTENGGEYYLYCNKDKSYSLRNYMEILIED